MKRLLTLAPLGVFLLVWEVVSRSGIVSAPLFPPPSQVAIALGEIVKSGELIRDVGISLVRWLSGLTIGVIGGVLVGLTTGSVPRIATIIEPLIQLFRPLPPVAMIPLIMVWFGIGEAAKLFSIAFAVFFPVWLNTHVGVRFVPQHLVWSAATPIYVPARIFWEVVLPASVPFVIAGVRMAISLGFIMVFVSELSGASRGLGYAIAVYHLAYRIDRMIAGLIVLAALGAVADRLFTLAVAATFPWLKHAWEHDEGHSAAIFKLPDRSDIDESTEPGEVVLTDVSITRGTTDILSHVNLRVRRGEFVAIVGSSGSGKTTLINAIAGFIPHRGRVERPERIGVVFQDHATFPWYSARKNVAFGLWGLNTSHNTIREIVSHHLRLAGLDALAERYPSQLSGGQVQRVGLARALAPDPELILMDEPFGALDLHTRERMQEWLLEMWVQSQKTILFVTHDIEEAIYLADRVLILQKGKIVRDVHVPFSRPRVETMKFSPLFVNLRQEILSNISSSNSTDQQPAAVEVVEA
jgi:ABC-type nitrate/sulfonate/bicarbonate transport system ATPase subunit/ABC-type nitrate/sulfonate/bicarbonate transport system permease component